MYKIKIEIGGNIEQWDVKYIQGSPGHRKQYCNEGYGIFRALMSLGLQYPYINKLFVRRRYIAA